MAGDAGPLNWNRAGESVGDVLGRIDDAAAAHRRQRGGPERRRVKPSHFAILAGMPWRGRRTALLQLLQAGEHQTIGLARERRREQRVVLRIAREFLGKRNELVTVRFARRRNLLNFPHSNIMAQGGAGSQPQQKTGFKGFYQCRWRR